ncbi:MAG: copper chaperone PCu(A)C [Hyphomicrobiaceae bacterium]
MTNTRSLLAAAALVASATVALAHDAKVGALAIDHPWTRATPTGARVAGGFMVITNKGTTADRLIGGDFEKSKRVEIHEMAMAGGVMKMRELPKGLEIKAGESVTLKPGSYHVMFMDLTQQLKKGDQIKGTLVFEKAGKVEVTYKVEDMGTRASSHGAGHGGHNMKH